MALVLIFAAALATPAAPARAAKTPPALACPGLQALARDRARPKAEMHKLNRLPPAESIYAMLRTKDGCPNFTPVRDAPLSRTGGTALARRAAFW